MTGFRTKIIVIVAVLVAACVFSLPLAVSHVEYYSADQVVTSLTTLFRWCWASLFDPSALPDIQIEISAIPAYYEVRTRLLVTLLTLGCGILLALSGAVYQLVFRNPIAAPTMLGVSNGVNIGVVILVVQFGSVAMYMTTEHYVYCFIGAFIVLLVVIGVTFLVSGRRGFSVITMLLVASIFSQVIGVIITYIVNMYFDDTLLIVYQEVLEVLDVSVSPLTFAVLGIVLLVSVVPMIFLRFSMNALSFSDEEANMMGISQRPLQIVSLALATIMIVAAEVLVGTVSMISLVVPFISRILFGAEFRRQLVGNLLLGPAVLLICRTITDSIVFVGEGFPISIIANFVLLPFFVIIIARGQRAWE